MKSIRFILALIIMLPAVIFGQTIIATYQIHDHASGLAYDGHNIWYGRYGTLGEWIYKFDIASGNIADSINVGTANLDDSYGLTWDGQYLWVTNHVGSDFTLKIDTLGNIISTFPNPSDYMSGLAWTGTYMYMGDYYNPDGAIYKCNASCQILESFNAPDLQPWDLAWDGTNLWMCDYNSNYIYQIDPVTHQTLYSFLSPMQDPAGIAWDGQYLWVCDEGQGYSIDHLYKIAPFGAGTPEIQLSASELDYGYVPLQMSTFISLIISNTGDADLTIAGMPMNPVLPEYWVDPAVTFPLIIAPLANRTVNIYFQPGMFGPVNSIMSVQSDDPINPSEPVELNGYGMYPQQYAMVSTNDINFGTVWIPQDGLTGRSFEIYNFGAAPLNLLSLSFNTGVFNCPDFQPGQLASMDTLELTVFFNPEADSFYQGVMALTTNAPNAPVIQVSLAGFGQTAAFSQGDIIWQYQAADPGTFTGFNSVKFMDDMNGDDIPEIIAANDNYMTYCINGQSAGNGDVFWNFDTGIDPQRTGPVEYQRGLVSAPDLNNDGVGDVVLGTGGGSRSVFAVSGADGTQLWCFDSHNYGGEGGWVYEVTCEDDWNNDNRWDVLAAVGGPEGSSDPKSVFLLNGTNGQVIWRAALGQTVYSVRSLGDVTNDGYSEVVCATTGYYVKRLNGQTGAVDWSHEVNYAIFSLNSIEDMNNDNIPDIVAAAGFSGVYCLSGANGNELWHMSGLGTTYYLEKIEDINGNGYDDMLVTSVSGTFYALDGRTGSTIWTLPLGSNVLALSVTPDITGDGHEDAVCGIMTGNFYAVNGVTGQIIFSYSNGTGTNYAFDTVCWLPDIDNSGAVELLGGSRNGKVFCFSGGDLATADLSVTLTPLTTPIVIPPAGGNFSFTGQIQNNGAMPANFDFWTVIILPNGSVYGPVLQRNNITLSAGASLFRQLSQNVPAGAPSGQYIYRGIVGDYGNQIVYDQSQFFFNKTAGSDGGNNGNWDITGWDENDISNGAVSAPSSFSLSAYPNPFNPSTTIAYSLPGASIIDLSVYNLQGQKIMTLASGNHPAGVYESNTGDALVVSGVYFVRLSVNGEQTAVKKIVLMK